MGQLLVPENSPIKTVADLRGKKIAATRGTDPFTLTLRALRENGLTSKDVELVALQHSDGYVAWQRGNVDAWAALDPFLANALLKDKARVLFHKVEFNTFGVLNVRQDFLQKYPLYVQTVVKAYERARLWIIAHPDEAAAILAEAAKLDLEVAKNQLSQRTGLTPNEGVGIPGPQLKAALLGVIPILVDEAIVKPGTDPAKSLEELIDPTNAASRFNRHRNDLNPEPCLAGNSQYFDPYPAGHPSSSPVASSVVVEHRCRSLLHGEPITTPQRLLSALRELNRQGDYSRHLLASLRRVALGFGAGRASQRFLARW